MKKAFYKFHIESLKHIYTETLAELINEKSKNEAYKFMVEEYQKEIKELRATLKSLQIIRNSDGPKTINELIDKIDSDKELFEKRVGKGKSSEQAKPALSPEPESKQLSFEDILPTADNEARAKDRIVHTFTTKDVKKPSVIVRTTTSHKSIELLNNIRNTGLAWSEELIKHNIDATVYVWVKDFNGRLYPKIEVKQDCSGTEVQFEVDSLLRIKEIHIKTFPIIMGNKIRKDITFKEADTDTQRIINIIRNYEDTIQQQIPEIYQTV